MFMTLVSVSVLFGYESAVYMKWALISWDVQYCISFNTHFFFSRRRTNLSWSTHNSACCGAYGQLLYPRWEFPLPASTLQNEHCRAWSFYCSGVCLKFIYLLNDTCVLRQSFSCLVTDSSPYKDASVVQLFYARSLWCLLFPFPDLTGVSLICGLKILKISREKNPR